MWCCRDCGDTKLNKTDFETHIELAHSDIPRANIIDIINASEKQSLRDLEHQQCPFCGKTPKCDKFIGHVSHHLEELSLSAIHQEVDSNSDVDSVISSADVLSDFNPEDTQYSAPNITYRQSNEEDQLLMQLIREEKLSWKDIATRFQTNYKRFYRVRVLQMRFKLLFERLVARPDTEIDLHSKIVYEELMTRTNTHVHVDLLETERLEEWVPATTHREPSLVKRHRNRPASYETSGGLDERIQQVEAYQIAQTNKREMAPATIEDIKNKGRKAQTTTISVSEGRSESSRSSDEKYKGTPRTLKHRLESDLESRRSESVEEEGLNVGFNPGQSVQLEFKQNTGNGRLIEFDDLLSQNDADDEEMKAALTGMKGKESWE